MHGPEMQFYHIAKGRKWDFAALGIRCCSTAGTSAQYPAGFCNCLEQEVRNGYSLVVRGAFCIVSYSRYEMGEQIRDPSLLCSKLRIPAQEGVVLQLHRSGERSSGSNSEGLRKDDQHGEEVPVRSCNLRYLDRNYSRPAALLV